MKLYKSHLAKAVSDKTGISVSQMLLVIDAMTASISRALVSGDEVKIWGFGKFQIKARKGRSGRNPRTGQKIEIRPHRAVGFTGFQHLRHRINRVQGPVGETQERRAETNRQNLPQGSAVVRISGIPVCKFPIKDISGNGTSILVARDSVVLRNLQVGQVIEIHMVFAEGSRRSTIQRSKIAHITPQHEGNPYAGHILVGLQVIDRI